MTDKQLQQHAYNIQKLLEANEIFLPVSLELSGNSLVIDIYHGDWKHDHLFIEHLVKTYCANRNIHCLHHTETYDEESNDDTYSAFHYFKLFK